MPKSRWFDSVPDDVVRTPQQELRSMIGLSYVWEPSKPRARKRLTVLEVSGSPESGTFVWTKDEDGMIVWNDLSRLVEAIRS